VTTKMPDRAAESLKTGREKRKPWQNATREQKRTVAKIGTKIASQTGEFVWELGFTGRGGTFGGATAKVLERHWWREKVGKNRVC